MSFTALLLLVVVGTTIWVGIDASRRDWGGGSGTTTWVIGCVLLWIVVFPVYLAKRGGAPLRDAPGGPDPERPLPGAMYRECPHCKESMRCDGSICPHCRQPSAAWRLHEGRWWVRDSSQNGWRWLDDQTGEWVEHDTLVAPADAP